MDWRRWSVGGRWIGDVGVFGGSRCYGDCDDAFESVSAAVRVLSRHGDARTIVRASSTSPFCFVLSKSRSPNHRTHDRDHLPRSRYVRRDMVLSSNEIVRTCRAGGRIMVVRPIGCCARPTYRCYERRGNHSNERRGSGGSSRSAGDMVFAICDGICSSSAMVRVFALRIGIMELGILLDVTQARLGLW
jgi:hypothetical protein